MILYDFEKIIETCKHNVNDVFDVLDMITHSKIAKNKFDRLYKWANIDFKGQSFMLHPDVAFYNSYKYTKKEVVQYFGIAAFRLTSLYVAQQIVTIKADNLPFDRNLYRENRLLSIDRSGVVHFKYEEVTEKEIH